MTARELMTESPATVSPRTTVAEVWDLMRELDVRHMPVVEHGVVVGVVSDRDLGNLDVVRLLAEGGPDALRRRLELPVARVMQTDVVAAGPDLDIGDVIALLLEHRVGTLPVVVPGTRRVVGMVSYVDVLRAVATVLEDKAVGRRPARAPGRKSRRRSSRGR
jgi:CBS domain-containing protein